MNLTCIDSTYKLNKHLQDNLHFVEPLKVSLGYDNATHKMEFFYYTPILETMKVLLSDPDVANSVFEVRNPSEYGSFHDYHDGNVYKEINFFHDNRNLVLKFYLDGYGTTNPIGTKRNNGKMCGVYFTIGNMRPWDRYKINNIQLAMLVNEKYLKKYGLTTVFNTLISDLKIFASEGVYVESLDEIVKGACLLILGDNLACHEIAGMNMNFSKSEFYCRFCEATRTDFMKGDYSIKSPRTVEKYQVFWYNYT